MPPSASPAVEAFADWSLALRSQPSASPQTQQAAVPDSINGVVSAPQTTSTVSYGLNPFCAVPTQNPATNGWCECYLSVYNFLTLVPPNCCVVGEVPLIIWCEICDTF